jgi:hypothetical protein
MTVRATRPNARVTLFFSLARILSSILRATRATPTRGARARIDDG